MTKLIVYSKVNEEIIEKKCVFVYKKHSWLSQKQQASEEYLNNLPRVEFHASGSIQCSCVRQRTIEILTKAIFLK